MSVPNQKIVRIHKTKYKENFLQISIDDWQAAVKVMTKCDLPCILYLAGNANGFIWSYPAKTLKTQRDIKRLHTTTQ